VKINPREERLLDDGWYPGQIAEVSEVSTTFGDKLLVPFLIEDGDATVEVPAWISFSDHPRSNCVKWGKALFGNRAFDTSEFSNQAVEVFVEIGEDRDGNEKNFVRKLRPRKNGGGKATGKSDGGKPTGKKGKTEPDESDFDDLDL
jgi:hypothetical protein